MYTTSQASTETAPITATTTTCTYGCTGRAAVTASLTSGSSTPATDDRDAPSSSCASLTCSSLHIDLGRVDESGHCAIPAAHRTRVCDSLETSAST